MTQATALPFDALTPDAVLDAVESLGLRCDGRLLGLNSYENRVYQIGMEEGPPLVAKFYRAGRWSDEAIAEEHVFCMELAEREIPVVAPLKFEGRSLHRHATFRFALYPRRGGRPPELDNADVLSWMGRFIARIHNVGALEPFNDRPRLDLQTFGVEPRDWLLAHDFIPAELRSAWQGTADMALDRVAQCFERAGPLRRLRLHGDCHASNVLWTDAGPHFVDFDDARMGPAVQDLWLLLSGDRAGMEWQLGKVLEGYEQFRELDRAELHVMEALRTLRLIHYSAWLARRWDDPAFPAAFPWFQSPRYWQDRVLELKEQVALMEEAPLFPA